MGLLREAACDDATGKGSSTRLALLWAAFVLGLGLGFALKRFDSTGNTNWVPIINTLCVCLATVLTGYASKLIASAFAKKDGEA